MAFECFGQVRSDRAISTCDQSMANRSPDDSCTTGHDDLVVQFSSPVEGIGPFDTHQCDT
jgi:hypothetical protein